MTDCVEFYEFSVSRVKDSELFLMRIHVPHLTCDHSTAHLLVLRTFNSGIYLSIYD